MEVPGTKSSAFMLHINPKLVCLERKRAWEGSRSRLLHSGREKRVAARLRSAAGDAAAAVPGARTQVLQRSTAPHSSWNWRKGKPGVAKKTQTE